MGAPVRPLCPRLPAVHLRRSDRDERSFYRGLLPFVTIQKVPEKALPAFPLERLLNANTPEQWEKTELTSFQTSR